MKQLIGCQLCDCFHLFCFLYSPENICFCVQIFDTGSLDGSFGSFQVCNVQIFGGFVLHIGSLSGVAHNFSVGDKVTCKVKNNF